MKFDWKKAARDDQDRHEYRLLNQIVLDLIRSGQFIYIGDWTPLEFDDDSDAKGLWWRSESDSIWTRYDVKAPVAAYKAAGEKYEKFFYAIDANTHYGQRVSKLLNEKS